MGITGKKTCYIAVLIGGQQFKYRKIEFDKELFDIMVEMAIRFWDCVQTHTLPSLILCAICVSFVCQCVKLVFYASRKKIAQILYLKHF